MGRRGAGEAARELGTIRRREEATKEGMRGEKGGNEDRRGRWMSPPVSEVDSTQLSLCNCILLMLE